jgi:hypothetical protein
MKRYLPTKGQVEKARTVANGEKDRYRYDNVREPADDRPSRPAAIEYIPEPLLGSRQKQGETFERFCMRMELEKSEYLASQSIEEIEALYSRETRAEREQNYGAVENLSVGVAMYRWAKVRGNHRLRTLVPCAEWQAFWSSSLPSSWRYQSFVDEWDLFSLAADTGGPDSDGFADPHRSSTIIGQGDSTRIMNRVIISGQVSDPCVQTPASTEEPENVVIRAQPLKHRDDHALDVQTFQTDLAVTYRNQVVVNMVITPKLSDILRKCYGFLAEIPYERHSQLVVVGKECGTVAQNDLLSAMARLGVKSFKYDDPLAVAVVNLYNHIMATRENPVVFPPLWDFDPAMSDRIAAHLKYTYTRIDKGMHIIGMKDFGPLVSQWYLLALPSACTVLQIFRENELSLMSIIRSLLNRGMPFATTKYFKQEFPQVIEPCRRVGLGYRRKGHNFDHHEYAAYEHAKRDILSSSVGRVAHLRGGI